MISIRHPGATIALNQLVSEGCAFLRNVILARLLGPEEMGHAVALALAIRLAEMIGDFGWERLVVQVEPDALDTVRKTVHGLQLLKGVSLAAIIMVFSATNLETMDQAVEPIVFVLASLSLVVRGAVNCDFRERQRAHEFSPALFVEGGSNAFALLATAPIVWLTGDYTAIAWAILLQAAALCLFSHIAATRNFSIGFDQSTLKRCFRYGTPIACNGVLMFIALQGDRFVVAIHFSAAELAGFAIAAQLTMLPALMGARFILASQLPRYARLINRNDPISGLLYAHLGVATAVAGCLTIFLGGLGNLAITAVYGAAYQSAPTVVWLLAGTAGLRLVRAIPNTLLLAQENTSRLFQSNSPRLLALPVALWLAANGAGLEVILALGVASESLALIFALLSSFRSADPTTFHEAMDQRQEAT